MLPLFTQALPSVRLLSLLRTRRAPVRALPAVSVSRAGLDKHDRRLRPVVHDGHAAAAPKHHIGDFAVLYRMDETAYALYTRRIGPDEITYPEYGKHPYAIYTRYPDGVAEDLKCPKCGAQEIVILKETEISSKFMTGDFVQCWMCKYRFAITENCWKFRRIRQ